MNISLTWANYALIVSACLVVYYSIVLLFYKKKLNPSFTKASDSSNVLSDFSAIENVEGTPKNLNLFGEEVIHEEPWAMEEEQDFAPDAQDFADEIVAYTSSCGGSMDKEELLQNLRKIILKYPSLADSESKYELNQLIAISSENSCSIHVSADELRELWKG